MESNLPDSTDLLIIKKSTDKECYADSKYDQKRQLQRT